MAIFIPFLIQIKGSIYIIPLSKSFPMNQDTPNFSNKSKQDVSS